MFVCCENVIETLDIGQEFRSYGVNPNMRAR